MRNYVGDPKESNVSEPRIKLRRRADSTDERKLLINLIINDEACKVLLPKIITKDLQATYSGKIVTWIRKFYEKEGEAPKKNIEPVFEKMKENLEPAEASIIDRLLKSLSEEYSGYEDVENTLSIYENKEYLKKQHSKKLVDEVSKLIEIGNVEKADNIVKGYEPVFTGIDTPALSQSIATFGQVMNEEIEEPHLMIEPWLIDGSISEIYGWRGTGKTWLAMIIGLIVSRGVGSGEEIGPWKVMHPGGVLYLDGEMGKQLMYPQMRKLKQGLKKSIINYPYDLICFDKFLKDRGYSLNLKHKELREEFYQYLKDHEQYNLLILDNLTSLFPGVIENTKEEWDPINQWLLKIRALNVAVIFIHNSGESGKQRGTTAREDNINIVLKLSRVSKKVKDAYLKIEFEKTRGLAWSPGLEPFTLRIVDSENGGLTWETDDAPASTGGGKKISEETKDLIKALLLDKRPQKEIVELTGKSQPKVSGVLQELVDLRLVEKDTKFIYHLTEKGEKSFAQMKHDGVLFGYEEEVEEL